MKANRRLHQLLQLRTNGIQPERGRLFLLAGLLLILSSVLLLTPKEINSDDNLQLEGRGLEGSWINMVSPILPPGSPPVTFQTYVTVSRGGAWMGSDRTKPFDSPQHGTWVHLAGHEYQWTLMQDRFDQAGNFLGTFKARSRARLIGRNEYVGVANIEVRDANGILVLARCARQRGVRIVVEAFAPPCQGLESEL